MPIRFLASSSILVLLVLLTDASRAETPVERLKKLPENSWLAIEPETSKRLVLKNRQEDAEVLETTSREPAFREYTSPALGDGKIFYFGGGHSGYYGNDVEIYDPVANVWRQCYRPVCPPKDDSTYYSGGSERSYVDPATGEGQPFVLHGYARTAFNPRLGRYVCTAMFPTEVKRDNGTAKWRMARQAFSYVGFDARTNRWELLGEVPDALKPGSTSLSYDAELGDMVAFSEHAAYRFKGGKWQLLGSSDVSLAASGGAAPVYLPQRKSHLLAVLGHGGAKEVGSLSLFDVEAKRGSRGPVLPDPLKRRVAAGTGGYNLIASLDSRQQKVVVMSVSEEMRPDVWTYDPANDSWVQLPTPTSAPKLMGVFEPGRGRAPLTYDAERNVFYLLYRDGEAAKLWAYRLARTTK
jgi:hypothetical protein